MDKWQYILFIKYYYKVDLFNTRIMLSTIRYYIMVVVTIEYSYKNVGKLTIYYKSSLAIILRRISGVHLTLI